MQTLQLKQVVTHHLGPIDLELDASAPSGLSGPSGAGKSLLLRAIADMDPHQGEILLNQQEQSQFTPQQWRHQVAWCAAESHWWSDRVGDHFSVQNPVTDENTSALVDLLAQAGFGEEALQWSVQRLSSGERQRLAIVRQLQRRPTVLLLDEPTASLDPDNIERMERLLLTYQQQQRAILLWVSHDRLQLERTCKRRYRIERGIVVEERS